MKTTINLGKVKIKEIKTPRVCGLSVEDVANLQKDHFEMEWDGGSIVVEQEIKETEMLIEKSITAMENNKEIFIDIFKSPLKTLMEMGIQFLKKESGLNEVKDGELGDTTDNKGVIKTVA